LLRLLLRLIEGEHRTAVGPLEVVGLREALGPVRAGAARGLHNPGAVGPVSAIEQLDAARQRRAGVGHAADRELEASGSGLEARSAWLWHGVSLSGSVSNSGAQYHAA